LPTKEDDVVSAAVGLVRAESGIHEMFDVVVIAVCFGVILLDHLGVILFLNGNESFVHDGRLFPAARHVA